MLAVFAASAVFPLFVFQAVIQCLQCQVLVFRVRVRSNSSVFSVWSSLLAVFPVFRCKGIEPQPPTLSDISHALLSMM